MGGVVPVVIDGVQTRPLVQIPDERGKVMQMLRRDDPHFEEFGEIYFSWVYPSVVKGWHLHTEMILNYALLVGSVKLVLFDDRSDSRSRGQLQEIYLTEGNYQLVRVPTGVWNGFKGTGVTPSLLANCATLPHDRAEIQRLDPFDNDIPYDWSLTHG